MRIFENNIGHYLFAGFGVSFAQMVLEIRRWIAALTVGVMLACASAPAVAAVPAKTKKSAKAAKPRTLTQKQIARRINKALAAPELRRAFWGIHVVAVDSGKTFYELNADKLFTPASNTKLFTTATALALLGPQYKVETTLETNGVLQPTGRLAGDLIIVGRGDPNLSGRVLPYKGRTERQTPHLRALEQLADTMVGAGLREVEGDIVGDDSLFAYQRYALGWGQDDLMWGDGAPASALSVNDNVIFLSVAPGNVGEAAKLALDPDVTYYEIVNRVVTAAAHSAPRQIAMDRQPGSNKLVVWGSIPEDDAGYSVALAIDDPAQYAASAFHEMLTRRGVVVHGKDRVTHTLTAELPVYALDVKTAAEHAEHGGASPTESLTVAQRTVLARISSRPLVEDVAVINKVSQNLHAELALRVIGKERGATPSLESALAAEKQFLTSIGIEDDAIHLYDGSGLSQHNLVTPRSLTQLLEWTQSQPWAQEYRESLPIAGEDGSLDNRFRETIARTRVWAKTGTLKDASSLSGFAETESGRKLVFAVLVNHHGLTGSGAKKVVDHIVELLVDDQTGRR